jgi:ribose 5-phosphate isomerase B
MRIALGTDHAGFRLKEHLKQLLVSLGHEVMDFGTHSDESVDYPVYVRPAVEAVARGECDRAIVLGGSGNGEAICANRVKGVRCALCWSVAVVELARRHNDANVISLGARLTSEADAEAIVKVWLDTPFDAGRHVKRIQMLDE